MHERILLDSMAFEKLYILFHRVLYIVVVSLVYKKGQVNLILLVTLENAILDKFKMEQLTYY